MHMLSTCDWLDDWLSIIILTYAVGYNMLASYNLQSTFSGYRSWWVRRSNATSSQRVPGLP